MGISPIRLFYLLLSSFFFGIGMGVVYDVHRIFRIFFGVQYSKKRPSELLIRPLPIVGRPLGEIRPRKWTNCFLSVLIFLQDVFFFCLAGVGVVILNYAYNDGQFRFYTVVALFVGFFSYYFTLGRIVIYLSEWIVFSIRAVLSILLFLLLQPFVKILKFSLKIVKKLQFNLQKAIANRRKKVYNIHREKEHLHQAKQGFLSERF